MACDTQVSGVCLPSVCRLSAPFLHAPEDDIGKDIIHPPICPDASRQRSQNLRRGPGMHLLFPSGAAGQGISGPWNTTKTVKSGHGAPIRVEGRMSRRYIVEYEGTSIAVVTIEQPSAFLSLRTHPVGPKRLGVTQGGTEQFLAPITPVDDMVPATHYVKSDRGRTY